MCGDQRWRSLDLEFRCFYSISAVKLRTKRGRRRRRRWCEISATFSVRFSVYIKCSPHATQLSKFLSPHRAFYTLLFEDPGASSLFFPFLTKQAENLNFLAWRSPTVFPGCEAHVRTAVNKASSSHRGQECQKCDR